MNLNCCPSCLADGYNTYCNKCLSRLFDKKKISHILPFTRPDFNKKKIEFAASLSLSGVQIKHSLKIEKGLLQLAESGGEYILKPIPAGSFDNLPQVPFNEHLTMQLARQVFKINTPDNGLVFFADGEPAYFVKRFDRLKTGEKLLQEDFAQLAGKTSENGGSNYKYDFSYEEIAEIMKESVKSYRVEIEKFIKLVLFNYLFSNGDAHLKNFSLFRNTKYGDYTLTPAYDLLNTKLHLPNDHDTALDLFNNNFVTEDYKAGSKYTLNDFKLFAGRIGIKAERAEKILSEMTNKNEKVEELVEKSFLSDELKKEYLSHYYNKLKRML